VDDPLMDIPLLSYAKTLSHRLQQHLTALILDEHFESTLKPELSNLKWMSLPMFSSSNIAHALERLQAGLLFLSVSALPKMEDLPVNFVIYSTGQDA